MQRDFKVYLEDVLEAIHRIRLYTRDLSYFRRLLPAF